MSTTPEAAAFARWERLVNAALNERVGLAADDLADAPYHDWFDDGIEPDEAADMALEDAGYFIHGDGPDECDGADSDF